MNRRKVELLPLVVGLVLLVACGGLLEGLLTEGGREALPVVDLHPVAGVDVGYAGAAAGDARFWELRMRLADLRPYALERAAMRTGLAVADESIFVVRFRDTAPGSQFAASSRAVRGPSGEIQLVTLSVQQALAGWMDLESVLVHEFVHGLMRQRMGRDRYTALPRALREGVAQWAAGQIETGLREALVDAYLAGRPEGVPPAGPAVDGQAELAAAMIFETLEARWGLVVCQRVLRDLMSGIEPSQALAQVGAGELADWQAQGEVLLRRRLVEAGDRTGLADMVRAQARLRVGDDPGALECLSGVAELRPGSFLGAQAWYWMARIYQQREELREAAALYRHLLEHFPEALGLEADARLRLARCLLERGSAEAALLELDRFFRGAEKPGAALRDEALTLLGRCEFLLGRYSRATQPLGHSARGQGASAAEAFYYLALAWWRAGDSWRSHAALAEFAYRYPRSPLLGELRRELGAVAWAQSGR